MSDYVKYSLPIIKKIAEWERLHGTAACMVSDKEKAEFWDFIKLGFINGSSRGALSALDQEAEERTREEQKRLNDSWELAQLREDAWRREEQLRGEQGIFG